MGDIGAGGPTPSCSLLKVSIAPLMVPLQMFSERVTLPILLTSIGNKAQRWGAQDIEAVCTWTHLGHGLHVPEHVSNHGSEFRVQTCV